MHVLNPLGLGVGS